MVGISLSFSPPSSCVGSVCLDLFGSLAMAPSGERLQCGAERSGCSVCCGYGSICTATARPHGLDELAGRMNDLSVVISLVPHLPHHVLPRPMFHLPRPMFVPVPLPTSMSAGLDIRLSSALTDLMCPSIYKYTGSLQDPGRLRNDGGAMFNYPSSPPAAPRARPVHLKSPGDKPPGPSGGWVPRSGGAHQQGARPVHDRYVPVAAARVTETVDSLPDAEIKSGQFPANVSLDSRQLQSRPGPTARCLSVNLSIPIIHLPICPPRLSANLRVS